jgi:hypothetical protein
MIYGYSNDDDYNYINKTYKEILDLLHDIIDCYKFINIKQLNYYKQNYDTIYKLKQPPSKKKPKLYSVTKNIIFQTALKSLAYHIECPKELIPTNNVCPKNYPINNNGCCIKDIYKSSTYKPNIDFVSKVIEYSEEQSEAINLYTDNGYIILSNFTANNLIIDEITMEYLLLQCTYSLKYFINKAENIIGVKKYNENNKDYTLKLYQETLITFYNSLKSCFIEECEENLIVYRGITTKNSYEVDSFVQFNTFISTSLNKEIANRFKGRYGTMFIIYIPKGTKLCSILNSEEKEILINCYSIFYIKSLTITIDTNIIEMVLIDRKEPKY